MDEATILAPVANRAGASALGAGNTRSATTAMVPTSPAAAITQVSSTTSKANSTGISEFDRVLGGGLVPGDRKSVV